MAAILRDDLTSRTLAGGQHILLGKPIQCDKDLNGQGTRAFNHMAKRYKRRIATIGRRSSVLQMDRSIYEVNLFDIPSSTHSESKCSHVVALSLLGKNG